MTRLADPQAGGLGSSQYWRNADVLVVSFVLVLSTGVPDLRSVAGADVANSDESRKRGGALEFWADDRTERRLDPGDLRGTVRVEFDLPDVRSATAMLDGKEVSDCSRAPGRVAGSRWSCLLRTASILESQCTGEQLQPKHLNGTYLLSIISETSDGRGVALPAPVTINNPARLMFSVEGKSVLRDGVRFYGGPNTISVSVCPVSYTGTQVGQFTLESKCINAAARLRSETQTRTRCTPLNLTTDDRTIRFNDPPYIIEIGRAQHGAMSNTANDGYVIVMTGDVVDHTGRIVTGEFGIGTANVVSSELLRFDFSPPSLADAEIRIGDERVVAGRLYSATPNKRFRLHGVVVTDHGAGVDLDTGVQIAVGDCAVNPREVNGKPIDRREQPFEPLYRDVTWIGELPEEDAVFDPDHDRGGAECYVAILARLVDRLGNAWIAWRTAEDQLQTPEFGVDKTPPVVSHLRLSRRGPFNDVADIKLRFNANDPTLSSGDDGSGVSANGAGVWVPGLGAVGPASLGPTSSGTGRVNVLPRSGTWNLAIRVADQATGANTALSQETLQIYYDGTPPVFADTVHSLRGPWYTRDYIRIRIEGSVFDDASGLVRVTATARAADSNEESGCQLSDTILKLERANSISWAVNDSSRHTFAYSDSMDIASPGGLSTENLCVLIAARDRLGNVGTTTAAYYHVHWAEDAGSPQLTKDTRMVRGNDICRSGRTCKGSMAGLRVFPGAAVRKRWGWSR